MCRVFESRRGHFSLQYITNHLLVDCSSKVLAIALVVFGIAGFFYAPSAFAVGEIFKVEATGTEYCSDGYAKFNASNNLDLWIHMVSENEILVSTVQNT
jgi:hypothetical protein